MAKLNVANLFDLARALATKAGAELRDPLTYLTQLGDAVLGALRNGLSLEDNFNVDVKTVSVSHGQETVIAPAGLKKITRITVDRVLDKTFYQVDAFGWKYTDKGEPVVKVSFAPTPPAEKYLSVTLVIHYG